MKFTDIGRAPGLREPVIYGETGHKTYIVESVGCGAALLVLSGSRLSGASPSTNRLYKNNRGEDGNYQAAMGLGIGDHNLDGSLDIVKTHFSDDTSRSRAASSRK